MPALEDQLRQHARWLDANRRDIDFAEIQRSGPMTPSRIAPADDDPETREGSRRTARRRVAFAIAAALVIFMMVASAVALRRATTEVTVTQEPPTPKWSVAPDYTFEGAGGKVWQSVWTGREAIIVGLAINAPERATANIVAADGTLAAIPALNADTNTWRTIAEPPGHISAARFHAFWTGSRLLIVGVAAATEGSGAEAVGAIYDPASDSWTSIAAAPVGRGLSGPAVWTGERVLMWTTGVGVTAYDPATDQWEILTSDDSTTPTTGLSGEHDGPAFDSTNALGTWTGSEFVVTNYPTGDSSAFDPRDRTWRSLPADPTAVSTSEVATGPGTDLDVLPTGSRILRAIPAGDSVFAWGVELDPNYGPNASNTIHAGFLQR